MIRIFVLCVKLSELESKLEDFIRVGSQFLHYFLTYDDCLLDNNIISILFTRSGLFILLTLEGVGQEVLIESVLQIEELRDQLRVVLLVLEIIDFLHAFEDLLALWAKSSVKLSKINHSLRVLQVNIELVQSALAIDEQVLLGQVAEGSL
jgi:hypothetical protein